MILVINDISWSHISCLFLAQRLLCIYFYFIARNHQITKNVYQKQFLEIISKF